MKAKSKPHVLAPGMVVDAIALAEMLGVNRSRIGQYVADGMPHNIEDGATRGRRFSTTAVIEWFTKRSKSNKKPNKKVS
jgi:phage terminase Nu1 subunit (DNA packaging protein)